MEKIEISIKVMKLSDNRKEYYTCIKCGDREITPNKYPEKYLNRAQYEIDELRWLLLGERKPSLSEKKYWDPK